LKDFLIELGRAFAFVGQQYHLDVGGEDYYLDLLSITCTCAVMW